MCTNYKISLALIVSLIMSFAFNADFTFAKTKKPPLKKVKAPIKKSEIKKPDKKSESIKDKQKTVLDLILAREEELKNRLADLVILHNQGLISLTEANIFKAELDELKQFEFIVKERAFNNYEAMLKDKIKGRIDNLQKEISSKEILSQEGLIAQKELEDIQEKAALYNYILEFLAAPRPTTVVALNQKTLNILCLFSQKFPISSKFGFRVDPIDSNRKQFHAGIDFAAYAGTPIKAPFNGKVIEIGQNLNSGGGLKIVIRHMGFDTVYMHLSEIKVKQGQIIQIGQIIGKVGSTGKRTTGPHLHFEIHLKGIPVDPMRFFASK